MSKRSSFNPSLDIQIDKDVQATYDNIKKVADNVNSITLVGSSIADIQNTNANIANINIVANNKTNIDNVVGNKTNINTVANDKTNIDTVATNISSVKTVATDMAKVNNYSDTYQGSGATDPTVRNDGSPLQAGDLFFNTTLNEMRVYSGTIWKSAGSTVNGTSKRQVFTATAGQTIFTITGGYDSGFADVYLNGTKLQNGVEVDVSNGTDVVLAVGATAGDIVDVVAYGAFAIANTYTKAEVDSKDALKADKTYVDSQDALKLDSIAYTASDVLSKLKAVDGGGSGLDADTVDGVQGALLGIGGAGYTWVNETANRASGVTYTNTTGKPIQVVLNNGSGSNATGSDFYVNGTPVSHRWDAGAPGHSIIVPANNTYVFVLGSGSIELWAELK